MIGGKANSNPSGVSEKLLKKYHIFFYLYNIFDNQLGKFRVVNILVQLVYIFNAFQRSRFFLSQVRYFVPDVISDYGLPETESQSDTCIIYLFTTQTCRLNTMHSMMT